ncbi:MAG: hypothetical protein HYS27_02815 [Deltaproteobacteria bacterium]|nr:hypothetical protein [Deltaproteobacteria bacterium]
MTPSGTTLRRAVSFAAACGSAVGCALALGVFMLRASPDRHVELSGLVFATVLAMLLGVALALVFSPRHHGARVLLDVAVAAGLWLALSAATWALLLPMLDNVVGVGLLFILPELVAAWTLLGAGLVGLVCVPWVRREAKRPAGVGFLLARTGLAVALFAAALALPRLAWLAGGAEASANAQSAADQGAGGQSAGSQGAATRPSAGGQNVEVRAHLSYAPTGVNQTIASRPLDEGQAQFPWVFRIDEQGRLAVGVNLVGTDLSWCTVGQAVAPGEHDVGFFLEHDHLRILLDGHEVARCSVVGALATSGEVVWGRVRHYRTPDDAQAFAGALTSTFARETPRR